MPPASRPGKSGTFPSWVAWPRVKPGWKVRKLLSVRRPQYEHQVLDVIPPARFLARSLLRRTRTSVRTGRGQCNPRHGPEIVHSAVLPTSGRPGHSRRLGLDEPHGLAVAERIWNRRVGTATAYRS